MTPSSRRPGRPKGARRDPAERRAELLDHAEAALRRHGPGVSMEQIAEQAGVAKATLYDNFDGRSGLTDALLDRYGNRVLRALDPPLDQDLTARDVVRNGIGIFIGFIEADPEVYRFILANTGSAKDVLADTAAPISALVGAVLRRSGVDSGGAEPFAYATIGSVFVAADWWATHRTMSRADFVDYLVAFVWSGLVGIGLPDSDEAIDLTDLARAIAEVPGPSDDRGGALANR